MSKATREAYGEEISKLIQENPKIVVLDADLAGSTYSGKAGEVSAALVSVVSPRIAPREPVSM